MLAVSASWPGSQRFRGPVPFSPPVVWFATNDDCPAGFGHPELVVLASGLAPSLLIDLRKYSALYGNPVTQEAPPMHGTAACAKGRSGSEGTQTRVFVTCGVVRPAQAGKRLQQVKDVHHVSEGGRSSSSMCSRSRASPRQ